jgi:hypothetical protein
MIVAFDYDGCLDNYKVQQFAKKLIAERNEVWVVTKRREGSHNVDLMKVLKSIMLPEVCVVYTNGKDKAKIIMGLNADLYIDNEMGEFEHINNHSNVLAVSYI